MGGKRNRKPDEATLARLNVMIEPIREFMSLHGKDNSMFQDESLPSGIWKFTNNWLKEHGVENPRSSNDYSRHKEYFLNSFNVQNEQPTQQSFVSSDLSDCSDKCKTLKQAEPSDRPECLEQIELDILRIVNEQLDMRILELQQAVQINQDNLLLPPDRVKVKGDKNVLKETRTHAKFSTTVDARLLDLFDRECHKRKMRRSEMLDAILYTFFGKPKMSDEK